MTIICTGQLVSSTISAQDLRDWIKDHKYSRTNLSGRKIFVCPKKLKENLVRDGAVELPRYIFNAASFWAETGRNLQLVEQNSAGLMPSEVRVREVTRDGRVVVMHPQLGPCFVEPEDLAKR